MYRPVITLLFLGMLLFPAYAHGAVMSLSFQGELRASDTHSPINGEFQVNFHIYDQLEEGIALWSEQQAVDFTEGLYSVTLGETSPLGALLNTQDNRYLEIQVFNAQSEQWETLSPRLHLNSMPYALDAETLDGMHAEDFLTTSSASASNGLDVQGDISLGATLGLEKLALYDGADDFYGLGIGLGRMTFSTHDAETMTLVHNGNLGLNLDAPDHRVDALGDGLRVSDPSAPSQAVVTLSDDEARLSSTQGLAIQTRTEGKDIILQPGYGKVGVNRDPVLKLDVAGSIGSTASGLNPNLRLVNTEGQEWTVTNYLGGKLGIGTDGHDKLTLTTGGAAGIGDDLYPSQTLHVVGDVIVEGNLDNPGNPYLPPPDFDSGWVDMEGIYEVVLDHFLGGDPALYFIDIQHKSYTGGYGINNRGLGTDTYAEGAAIAGTYYRVYSDQIKVRRVSQSSVVTEAIRARIWKPKEE